MKTVTVIECRSNNYLYSKFADRLESLIKFDPDRIAEFFNKNISKKDKLKGKSLTFDVCDLYAKGNTFTKISNMKGLHGEQVKREVIKALKWFLEHYEMPETTSEDEKCIQPEMASIS
jgi:hypothetical protein